MSSTQGIYLNRKEEVAASPSTVPVEACLQVSTVAMNDAEIASSLRSCLADAFLEL